MEEPFQEYKDLLPLSLLQDVMKQTTGFAKTKIRKILDLAVEEYVKIQVEPGECVGIVSAESIGEPGTQMSIAADEKIIVRHENKIKIVEIGKFIDSLMNVKGSLHLRNTTEVLPLHDFEFFVPSIDPHEKIHWKRVIECSRHKSPKKLLRLKTASGREIIATDNHSFVTRLNNTVVPVLGKELARGDRIPILNNFLLETPAEQTIHASETLMPLDSDIILEEETDTLSKVGRKIYPMKNTIELNWLTGWFVGAYLAEGFTNSYQLGISNLDDGYMVHARDFVHSIGLHCTEDIHQRGFALSRDIKVNSVLLSKFIIDTCSAGSRAKHIPEFAYAASNEFVAGLLRAYFDGDGNFHTERKMIRVSSNSQYLLEGISLLLSRFKIFSFKFKDKKNQYWLLIPYKYAPLFLSHIGSDIQHKRECLEVLATEAKKFWKNTSQDYTDMISGFGDLFYRTAKKVGYPTRYVNNFTKRQKIGRTALYRYMKLFEQTAKEKEIDIAAELAIMSRMFNSDVVWDEIVDIEYIQSKHEYVYDLSVPGLETFTTFNGVITHNTLNTFHFAGVSEMNVTTGLPRIIEVLDGSRSLSTPMMEIYLQEPYKSGSDLKKAAQLIQETTLQDIASEFLIDIPETIVEVKLDAGKMEAISLNAEKVHSLLDASLKGVTVKLKEASLFIKPKGKDVSVNELYKLKEKSKSIYVAGVKGIKQVLPVKRGDEFIIVTAGSNLKSVFELDFVDATRTISNDIFEVYDVLGIEAAREAVVREVFKIINEQGLNVDVRHLMLVADAMCVTGKLRGITRYGIVSQKSSVLAKASFETPIRHVINAAIVGEKDDLNSVVENVMINQPIPVGTGLLRLVTKDVARR